MEKYHRFLLSDLNWTFINTKRNTYLNLPHPRTLYMYSSLCAPEHMGDQTTDLIHQIHYQPILEGNYYYEPKQIHYIKLCTNHIDVAETQISESENNNLAQFTSGASIVTLHFRHVRLTRGCHRPGKGQRRKMSISFTYLQISFTSKVARQH